MSRASEDAEDRGRLCADIAAQITEAPPADRAALLVSVAVMVLLSLSPEASVQFGAVAELSVSVRRQLMRLHAKNVA